MVRELYLKAVSTTKKHIVKLYSAFKSLGVLLKLFKMWVPGSYPRD